MGRHTKHRRSDRGRFEEALDFHQGSAGSSLIDKGCHADSPKHLDTSRGRRLTSSLPGVYKHPKSPSRNSRTRSFTRFDSFDDAYGLSDRGESTADSNSDDGRGGKRHRHRSRHRRKNRERKRRNWPEGDYDVDAVSSCFGDDAANQRKSEKQKNRDKAVFESTRAKNGLRINSKGEIELPSQSAVLFAERWDDSRLRAVRKRMLKGKSRDVFLKIYDITSGRAAQWLRPLMGTQVDGIWHTGMLVYGKEHFYCDGIQSMTPDVVELTFAMQLRDILYLGKASTGRNKVQSILHYRGQMFTPQSYDLINWNCNHFTEAFLTDLFPHPKSAKPSGTRKLGQSDTRLPGYILEQPARFMSTVRGRILIWMVKNILERVDNFINENFQAGLDEIIAKWFGAR